MNRTRLEAEGVWSDYGARTVIADVDLAVPVGSVTVLIGPNGSGKTTLLRSLGRLLPLRRGTVTLDGSAIHSLPTRRVARVLGILPQSPPVPAGLTVRQLVEQGRYPHLGPLRTPGTDDARAIEDAVRVAGVAGLTDRPVDELSGGERQRVWMAVALAQQASTLLLDEPTTFLDLGHQLEILDLIVHLRATTELTVVAVLHDLDHAFRIADQVVVLRDGRVVGIGPPDVVLTPATIREVFGVEVQIHTGADGQTFVLPVRPLRADDRSGSGTPTQE